MHDRLLKMYTIIIVQIIQEIAVILRFMEIVYLHFKCMYIMQKKKEVPRIVRGGGGVLNLCFIKLQKYILLYGRTLMSDVFRQ